LVLPNFKRCCITYSWKFTGPNYILEFIFICLVLNKNWKVFGFEQNFTGLGPEDRCSSWGLYIYENTVNSLLFVICQFSRNSCDIGYLYVAINMSYFLHCELQLLIVFNISQVYQYFTIYRWYFLLIFEQYSWVSYTTLFKIRRYQRPI
jgi:hypothetical protein